MIKLIKLSPTRIIRALDNVKECLDINVSKNEIIKELDNIKNYCRIAKLYEDASSKKKSVYAKINSIHTQELKLLYNELKIITNYLEKIENEKNYLSLDKDLELTENKINNIHLKFLEILLKYY